MKKLILISGIFFLLSSINLFCDEQKNSVPKNLVINSLFEELTDKGTPVGWSADNVQLVIEQISETEKTVKLMLPTNKDYVDLRTNMFDIEPGAEYYIEFRTKKDEGCRLIPMMVFLPGERANRKEVKVTNFPDYPENLKGIERFTVFYGTVKAPEEKEFTKGYLRFYFDWFKHERTEPKNLYIYGVKVYKIVN